jgi:hypothetical protein
MPMYASPSDTGNIDVNVYIDTSGRRAAAVVVHQLDAVTDGGPFVLASLLDRGLVRKQNSTSGGDHSGPAYSIIILAGYATVGTPTARVIDLAPVASSQRRVGVRAIRITTELQLGQRMTMPIPWAYTSKAPTDLAAPHVAHVVRADVKS